MDDLTRAVAEELRKSKALQAAMAFGVPEGANLTCLEAIADDIAPLIEARVREARADAWDEGHAIGAHDQANLALFNIKPTPNPYRDEESNA